VFPKVPDVPFPMFIFWFGLNTGGGGGGAGILEDSMMDIIK
jgi:hypothetical protein